MMIIQFSSSAAFNRFSSGFLLARLLSFSLVSSPLCSVVALNQLSWLGSRRSNIITAQISCSGHRWINSWPTSSRTSPSPLFSADLNIESSGHSACYDERVLRLLDETTIERIDSLVRKRSSARWQGNYDIADNLKSQIIDFSDIPDGYQIVLQDISRSEGGGSRWNLVPAKRIYDEKSLLGPTILQLAHAAIGLAVENNQHTQTAKRKQYRQKSLEALVENAKGRLDKLLEEVRTMDEINSVFEVSTKNSMVQNELGGRTASDAALWFAFAGSRDKDLFHGLADIASWELQRFGQRPSFRSKYTLQIVERFAAAGLKEHDTLERIARASLLKNEKPRGEKETPMTIKDTGIHHDGNGEAGKQNYFNLHSDRSLLLIWKFASNQKKQRVFSRSVTKNLKHSLEVDPESEACRMTVRSTDDDDENQKKSKAGIIAPSVDWNELYQDASRPLVIDVGCGMGVSLLGLASTDHRVSCSKNSSDLLLGKMSTWSDCNFAGVDLGSLGIEYARGVAHRWGLEENLHFAIDDAEHFCRHLGSYPGEILCCMIQFPTPFRLKNKDRGNSQLPASQLDGFMVTENLLGTIHSALHPTKGKLLLQSNCEDVAVWMQNLACQKVGFTAVNDDAPPNSSSDQKSQRIPLRTVDWINMGGERAIGRGWFRREILPRKGATETEVSCGINGTPVHRCLLKVENDDAQNIKQFLKVDKNNIN